MSTDAMQVGAGRELDAAVAERFMGIRRIRRPGYNFNPPRYSTEITAAWEVFTHPRLLDTGWEPLIEAAYYASPGSVTWKVGFDHWSHDAHVEIVHAPKAIPEAICRTALAALNTSRTSESASIEAIHYGPCKCGGYGQVFAAEAQRETGRTCHAEIKGPRGEES